MSDQGVREIQLGGKQLVFLFMALVVGAVAVFLLGISVGRGVRSASGDPAPATDVAVAGEPIPPAEMPPPTETTPADLRYHDQLQGQTPPPAADGGAATSRGAEPSAPPVQEAPPSASPPVTPAPAPAAASKPEPVTAAASRTADKSAATATAPPGGWFIQVNAFRSRENANNEAGKVKAKGHANVAVSSMPGGLFRVRVGPYADRDEANRVAQRLRTEGFSPSAPQR